MKRHERKEHNERNAWHAHNTSKQALVEETAVVAGKSHFYTNLMSLQSERDEEKVEETGSQTVGGGTVSNVRRREEGIVRSEDQGMS